MRADLLLVQRGLVPSRSAAQRLIEHGAAEWQAPGGWRVLRKAGEDLPSAAALRVADDAEVRWVSRGGLKLEGALACTGLDVTGLVALDVGQSTGGFTEVLLARGAARVVGIDVGHDQLHPRLRADPRVAVFEGLNARALLRSDLAGDVPAEGFGLIVGDLSFISLTRVLPALAPLLAVRGSLLMLVKPQFELQPADIGKGGLVRDKRLHAQVEARLRAACAAAGLRVDGWFESAITGGDGNREFFVRASPGDTQGIEGT